MQPCLQKYRSEMSLRQFAMSWPGAPRFKASLCNSSCSRSWNVSHRVPPLPHGFKEFANASRRNHAYSHTKSSAPATPTESEHNRRPRACYSAGQPAADTRTQGQSRAGPSLVSTFGNTKKTTQLFRIVFEGEEMVGVRCAVCVNLGMQSRVKQLARHSLIGVMRPCRAIALGWTEITQSRILLSPH